MRFAFHRLQDSECWYSLGDRCKAVNALFIQSFIGPICLSTTCGTANYSLKGHKRRARYLLRAFVHYQNRSEVWFRLWWRSAPMQVQEMCSRFKNFCTSARNIMRQAIPRRRYCADAFVNVACAGAYPEHLCTELSFFFSPKEWVSPLLCRKDPDTKVLKCSIAVTCKRAQKY